LSRIFLLQIVFLSTSAKNACRHYKIRTYHVLRILLDWLLLSINVIQLRRFIKLFFQMFNFNQEWKSPFKSQGNVINRFMWSHFKCPIFYITSYFYQSVTVITFSLARSDHIKRLLLFLYLTFYFLTNHLRM